ncbi:sensor histidine kinase [Paenibacillus hemerocallicola]|nr:sensor histidine kinase [Paenibacillus hemerocallicola]
MLAYLKDFLLNLFFILFPIVFYPHLLKIERKPFVFNLLVFLLFSVTLICTMSFPVEINGMIFDFRIIPLIVGSILGGIYVTIFLFIDLIVYRYLQGAPNPLMYSFSVIPSVLLLLYYLKYCKPSTVYQKIVSAVGVGFLARLLILITYYLATNNIVSLFTNNFASTLFLIVIQSICCGLYIWAAEYFRANFYIQQQLQHSEKIKIISDIAASVAHEIRNPLTSVRGFIQLLGSGDLNQEKKTYYQKICLEELDRAQKIISDYLSLAKPDPENNEIIELEQELQYASNILNSYANYQNIEINITIKDRDLFIYGDKFKLRQAIINIGKNAIEAMTEDGLLELELVKLKKSAVLIVKDNGIGMSLEQINRLGTPYYSTKDKGTGLGTMVSFSIIRKMQGTIEVHSEKWKGTTFTIAFPLHGDH